MEAACIGLIFFVCNQLVYLNRAFRGIDAFVEEKHMIWGTRIPPSSRHSHRRHSINITNLWVNLKAFYWIIDNVVESGLICTVLLPLNRRFVSNRHHSLDSSLRIDCPLFPRSQRLSLQEHVYTLRFRLLLFPRVVLNPIDEFFS